MLIRNAKNTTPLCFLPDGELLCYKRGRLFVSQEERVFFSNHIIPISKRDRYFGKSKYLSRLFRIGIRSALAIDNRHILLSIGSMIYEYDLDNDNISDGWFCGEGVRPLSFSEVKGIRGFDDGVYFGGYLSNRSKKAVSIYKRISTDQWETIYTFPEGAINHVHIVVPDSYRTCVWIFTGDFDEASAIWKVTNNFKKVECVASNEQRYRACVVFALPEGLLYATDAPYAEDFIYMLNPETIETKELFPIHGSCIYGCQWKDKYVFSSTVEGDGRNTSRKEFYFGRKRGAGIKDDYVHMYVGTPQEGFKEIYKEKKDFMPYYTFQFGVFKFPAGVNNSNTLYFQPVATKKYDMDLMAIRM